MSLGPDSGQYSLGSYPIEYFPPASSKYQAENWIELLPDTPHNNFLHNLHWSKTPLGNPSTWPLSLRLYVRTILAQPSAPMALHWGPDQTVLYNESFIPLLGSAHPSFMGSSFLDDEYNFRDPFKSLFRQLEESGTGTALNCYCLFVKNVGYVKE